MSRLLILNGPNVGLIGVREPHLYGRVDLETGLQHARQRAAAHGMTTEVLTSNHEGELVDRLHALVRDPDRGGIAGVIVNPGGLTAYGVSLRDALAALALPVIVVHVSNRAARTDGGFRSVDVIAPVSAGQIIGLGVHGYGLAVDWFGRTLSTAERVERGQNGPAL